MGSGKKYQQSKYAERKYGFPHGSMIDLEEDVKYGTALLAIAAADGELAEEEKQWFIDEQELMGVQSEVLEEYLETLRKVDCKNMNLNIEELFKEINYDFPVNYHRCMLYQAIKMSRADGVYHEKEKAAVAQAAEILGIERSVVVSLEALAEMEEAADRLRIALFESQPQT